MNKHDYDVRVDSDKLRAMRKRERLTQSEVADKLGISIGAYKSKESGETSFKDSEKLMLFDLLHMSYDEFDKILFGGKLAEMRPENSEEKDDLIFLMIPVSKRKVVFPDSDDILPQIRGSSNAG